MILSSAVVVKFSSQRGAVQESGVFSLMSEVLFELGV